MKTNMLKSGLLASALVLLSLGFTSTVFAHTAHVDINVGVVTQGVDQDVQATAFADNAANAAATAANGVASITDSVDQNASFNVGVMTNNVDQDATALANSGYYGYDGYYGYGYGGIATATATAANAVASLNVSGGYSPAMNVGVATNYVSQDASALATSFNYANAAATAANGIVSITVH